MKVEKSGYLWVRKSTESEVGDSKKWCIVELSNSDTVSMMTQRFQARSRSVREGDQEYEDVWYERRDTIEADLKVAWSQPKYCASFIGGRRRTDEEECVPGG